MNEDNEIIADEFSNNQELDFLLGSLSTSDQQEQNQGVVQNIDYQNLVNVPFSSYSPIPYQLLETQTPSPYNNSTYSPLLPNYDSNDQITNASLEHALYKRRKRNADRPIDLDRSRIAQRRKRDDSGKFLKKEVAMKIEELESRLKEREDECNTLKHALSVKDQEIQSLRAQLQNQTLFNQTLLNPNPTVSFPSSVPMINLPSRNYVLIPNPNPQHIGPIEREAFKEKIDYSKIQLRKTERFLDDERREVMLSQEEWEERRRFHEFIRKLEEQQRWYNFEFGETNSIQPHSSIYGGPPSNIYSPPTKIGNLQVPAFTTKVDFSTKREELGKPACKYETRQKPEYVLIESPSAPNLLQKSNQQPTPSRHTRNHSMGKFSILPPQSPPIQIQNQMKNIQPFPNIDVWDDLNEDMDLEIPHSTNIPRKQYILGGPPSNIYTPPTKIGNLPVPAFTQKIDFSEIELRKTDGPYSSSPPL